MEQYTLTAATWFWFLVPMPLIVVWAIWSYVKEGADDVVKKSLNERRNINQ